MKPQMAPFVSYVYSYLSLPVLRAALSPSSIKRAKDERASTRSALSSSVSSLSSSSVSFSLLPSASASSSVLRPPVPSSRPIRTPFPLSQSQVATLTSVFTLFSFVLFSIYITMPRLDRNVMKIPKNLDDLRFMKEHISVYTKDYTMQVLVGYVSTYIFMQTFMIPGTIFFSLLAGGLFGLYKGVLLVIFSATAGASSCYFLSKLFGAPIAIWLWPNQIRFFRSEVAKRKGKLLNYLLFLRVTPTLPNTLINFASPIVDVPYHIFFLATVIGLIPASVLSVRAGLTLGQLESVGDLYDGKTVSLLFMIGLLFILPTIVTKKVSRPM